MSHPLPHRKVLASFIALALTTGTTLPVHAADDIDCKIDPDHSTCTDENASGSKLPWILGGVALAAAAAAGGGGGGGGSDHGG
ncbi:hypothetical protein, partial [Stenotrophomonas sp. 278]|uniref:hypothetical protein n=1 Tax=Stenotrophomonas sp. 278 TaxID=2479851 RepID=UPI000FA5BAE2